MKIFISHASKDASVARQLADKLVAAGHSVWIPENEFLPGDNWAKKLGQAIEEADTIIVLVTHEAAASESVTREVQYALTADHIKGRVIPVFIGLENKDSADFPWILSKLQPLRIRGDKGDWQKVVDKVETLAN